MISGVPLKKVDNKKNKLNFDLLKNLQKQIIGQDEAIEVVVNAIQRNQTGLKDPNKPIGSFYISWTDWSWENSVSKKLGSRNFQ